MDDHGASQAELTIEDIIEIYGLTEAAEEGIVVLEKRRSRDPNKRILNGRGNACNYRSDAILKRLRGCLAKVVGTRFSAIKRNFFLARARQRRVRNSK